MAKLPVFPTFHAHPSTQFASVGQGEIPSNSIWPFPLHSYLPFAFIRRTFFPGALPHLDNSKPGPWHHLMGAELSAQQQQQKSATKTGKSGTAVDTAGRLLIRWPLRTKLLPAGQKTKSKHFHSTVTVEDSNTDLALNHQQKCPQRPSTANSRSMHRWEYLLSGEGRFWG